MNIYRVIGLMSGTSLDGLDIVNCEIWEENSVWNYSINEVKTISYDEEMTKQLSSAITFSAEKLLKLNNDYGIWLGKEVNNFIRENNLIIDFIASHGHTIHHQPENSFTYQLGSGQQIANITKHKVICDFRTNDVALGGQGAPLVPIGDQLFFNNYDFCLNLGGISNISFEKNEKRIAFDIGLANMILNYITQKEGVKYDDKGKIASKGKINESFLTTLNALAYYKISYPKSTGYEWFADKVIPIIESHKDSMSNLLHTAIHHNCQQIANEVIKIKDNHTFKILVTGGGALNDFFMEILQLKLGENAEIVPASQNLINYKEALVFALMGVLRIENKINVLKTVTGASSDSSSGVLFLPQFQK